MTDKEQREIDKVKMDTCADMVTSLFGEDYGYVLVVAKFRTDRGDKGGINYCSNVAPVGVSHMMKHVSAVIDRTMESEISKLRGYDGKEKKGRKT